MNVRCSNVVFATDTFMHLYTFVGLVNKSDYSVYGHGLFKIVSNIIYADLFLLFIHVHVC